MSKQKKKNPIIGIGQVPEEKLTVLKSNPLASLWRSDLTLAEFKILDIYLARINSHYPDRRQVEISRKEFEDVFGISKFNIKELDLRLEHLIKQAIKIADKSYKRGFAWVSLFEEARVDFDENGVQKVYLECTQKAMKYFFNVENLGYFRYKLKCIKDMKSRYTYVLFNYLEKHRNMGLQWEVDLQELKSIMNCDQEETYKEFKYFNQRILQRCQKELHEKTDCRFSYEPIRQGRSVTKIKFTLERLTIPQSAAADPEQITVDQYLQDATGADLWVSALDEFRFTIEQIDGIRSVLVTIPDYKLPESPEWYDSIDLRRYHYMRMKSADITQRNADHPIRNKYAYLMTILKRDAGIQ